MGRTVVHNPEDAPRRGIRWLAHHISDEAIKGGDPVFLLTTTEESGTMNVKSSKISPSATACVFMLHFHRRTRLGGVGGMATPSLMDTGFLICRQNNFIVLERTSLPHSFIEIQDAPRFHGKIRIAGKDPGAIPLGPNSILMKPAPDGAVAAGADESRLPDLPAQIGNVPSGKRHFIYRRQFTRQSFNLDDQLWGEKPEGVPTEDVPQARRNGLQKTVFATC